MTQRMLFSLLALILFPSLASAQAADDACVACHRERTPGAVAQWQASGHAAAGIGCADCHGNDHERIEQGAATVDAAVCGACHEQALREHAASRHGIGLHSGWGCTRNQPQADPEACGFCHQEQSTLPVSTVHCARFLKQTDEMREVGCNRCHQVQNSCASCHTNHQTDLAIVRDPGVCASCHMGPDHPQWEMWQTSVHGTLYQSSGGAFAPTCQRCHMPSGTHNVSGGLTATPGGMLYPEAQRGQSRKQMVTVCAECHAPAFARAELARADAVRTQGRELLKEAEAIIHDLADRNLLEPMPEDRPPHPLAGNQLVTGPQMLYEDISHVERLFFKMKKFDYAKMVKGTFHQNPAYAHWYGNAELKMDLVDIRSEASRLRQRGAATVQTNAEDDPLAAAEGELLILKKKFERGALDEAAYSEQKGLILERVR